MILFIFKAIQTTGGKLMNKTRLNEIEKVMYRIFINTNYLLIFIWFFKTIIVKFPGGDDGGGGL